MADGQVVLKEVQGVVQIEAVPDLDVVQLRVLLPHLDEFEGNGLALVGKAAEIGHTAHARPGGELVHRDLFNGFFFQQDQKRVCDTLLRKSDCLSSVEMRKKNRP